MSAAAVPSGLAMLDVDHVENPRAWFSLINEATLVENGIYLVAITASRQGIRVIGQRMAGESIEAAQMRMAKVLSIKEYDSVTKDLARASYVVPRSYILWIDEDGLFREQDFATPTEEQPIHPLHTHVVAAEESHVIAAEELSYHDIPYSAIVDQLMIAMGIGGGAEKGDRNNTYFALARYIRYICDFDAEKMLQVLPDFGLTIQERRQTIASALGRPRRDELPMVLQSAITLCSRDLDILNHPQNRWPLASEMELPALPRLLRILCRRLPIAYRAAMIIASLPVLGTLATRVRFKYLDKQSHSFSFFTCITAPAASGKSFIRKPLDLLLTPINEQDAIEREKEQHYKDRLRASKNAKSQPEDPHACPRNNGVAISIAKLLQLMTYSEGKHLIGIAEEMDTLVKSEKAGVWSQKNDIYRLAFDNGEYGQAYMNDQTFNAHIKVYYNLLLTGTPNSMRRFFTDLENGLVTRVCFAQLPDTSFAEMPEFDDYTPEEQAEVIEWSRRLEASQGDISCGIVSQTIARWLEEKRQEAIDADNHAMDVFRRRAGVIGFRAGMLCYLLENKQETQTVADFAKWIAEFVFRNQMELWGEPMEQQLSGALDAQAERGAASSLLGQLPKEFTTTQLIQLRARKGQSVTPTSVNSLLCRWKKVGRITKIDEGHWRKLV